MKIEINKIENKKEFIDECYGILTSYRRLLKNYKLHFSKRSTKLIRCLILVLIYFVFVTYSSIIYKSNVFYICLGISIMTLIITLIKMIRYFKFLNIQSKNKTNSELIIDKEKVTLDNKVINTTYTISWNQVKAVLVTKNVIIFMKEIDRMKQNNIIMVSSEYEKSIKEALEKYNKKDLLIYNK